jgi:hypothetical protein
MALHFDYVAFFLVFVGGGTDLAYLSGIFLLGWSKVFFLNYSIYSFRGTGEAFFRG